MPTQQELVELYSQVTPLQKIVTLQHIHSLYLAAQQSNPPRKEISFNILQLQTMINNNPLINPEFDFLDINGSLNMIKVKKQQGQAAVKNILSPIQIVQVIAESLAIEGNEQVISQLPKSTVFKLCNKIDIVLVKDRLIKILNNYKNTTLQEISTLETKYKLKKREIDMIENGKVEDKILYQEFMNAKAEQEQKEKLLQQQEQQKEKPAESKPAQTTVQDEEVLQEEDAASKPIDTAAAAEAAISVATELTDATSETSKEDKDEVGNEKVTLDDADGSTEVVDTEKVSDVTEPQDSNDSVAEPGEAESTLENKANEESEEAEVDASAPVVEEKDASASEDPETVSTVVHKEEEAKSKEVADIDSKSDSQHEDEIEEPSAPTPEPVTDEEEEAVEKNEKEEQNQEQNQEQKEEQKVEQNQEQEEKQEEKEEENDEQIEEKPEPESASRRGRRSSRQLQKEELKKEEEETESVEEDDKTTKSNRKRARSETPPPPAKNKRFQTIATQLITQISSNRFASMFLQPVSIHDEPEYYKLIKHPQDLKTIQREVKQGKITSLDELQYRLQLMFTNAVMYNDIETETYKWTIDMMEESEKLVELFRESIE